MKPFVTPVIYIICGAILLFCIYVIFTGHLIFSFLDLPQVIESSSLTNSSMYENESSAANTLNESYKWTLSTIFQGLSALLGIAFAFLIYQMNILDISKDRLSTGWGKGLLGGPLPPPPIKSHAGVNKALSSLNFKLYILLFYFLITSLITLSGLTFQIYFYNNLSIKYNILISSLLLSIGVILLFFDLIYHITTNYNPSQDLRT
ncbi:hypothetical protein BGV40_02035 [Methanosarcina sp. Ant1]|nr:hypothetical protein BGV40_02035 [Methanosarcina sp. Ant1]